MLICAQNTIHIISKNVKQNSVNFLIIPSFPDHTQKTLKKEMGYGLRRFLSVSEETVGIMKVICSKNQWLSLSFREHKDFNGNQELHMRIDLLGLWDHSSV